MLEQLPEQLPFPVCLIQHIASGFSTSLSEWLAKHSRMPVHCMEDGGTLAAGNIYIAPGGSIAGLKNASTFSVSPANDTLPSPSIDVFFEAVEKHYGNKCIAVLMSGMGRDGANGLLKLRNAGAETIVQDRESSVVYGMPGEALELAAARHIMSPDEIVEFIKNVDCSA
jgi:two-component system chemotaxis response regulator CheB